MLCKFADTTLTYEINRLYSNLRKWVYFFLVAYIALLIPNRLVNISPQWRSRRGSQEIRWLWISSSRGRRGSSLPYLELLPLVVPRLSFHFCLPCLVHSRLCNSWPWIVSFCFQTHLPGFVQQAEDLKTKGIQEVACISVNDAFVMAAWGKEHGTDGKV